MRPRRAISKTSGTFGAETIHPPVRALARNTQLLGDVGDRPAIPDNPINEQTTTVNGQASISVGHEDLLGVKTEHLH